jgi:hypothetical protein
MGAELGAVIGRGVSLGEPFVETVRPRPRLLRGTSTLVYCEGIAGSWVDVASSSFFETVFRRLEDFFTPNHDNTLDMRPVSVV